MASFEKGYSVQPKGVAGVLLQGTFLVVDHWKLLGTAFALRCWPAALSAAARCYAGCNKTLVTVTANEKISGKTAG